MSRRVDQELRIGALAHYADPAYYARAYRTRTDDIAFYVARAASQSGKVLEYGCGSGRITLPIARAGVDVVGVDWSKPMLDALADDLANEPRELQRRVRTRRGDMRALRLSTRFPLVFATFNVLLHLYDREDLSRFLRRVRSHLTAGGELIFDTSVPLPSDLARDPSRTYALRPFMHPTLGGRVRYHERFDYDPLRQILFVSMEFTPEDGSPPLMTPLAHRQWFPAELSALLDYEGFEVIDRRGGFGGERLEKHSDTIVWTCRQKRSTRA